MKSRRDYGQHFQIQSPQEFKDNWEDAFNQTGKYLMGITFIMAGIVAVVRVIIPLFDFIGYFLRSLFHGE